MRHALLTIVICYDESVSHFLFPWALPVFLYLQPVVIQVLKVDLLTTLI